MLNYIFFILNRTFKIKKIPPELFNCSRVIGDQILMVSLKSTSGEKICGFRRTHVVI